MMEKGLIVVIIEWKIVWRYYWTMEDLKKEHDRRKNEKGLTDILNNNFSYIDESWTTFSYNYIGLDDIEQTD